MGKEISGYRRVRCSTASLLRAGTSGCLWCPLTCAACEVVHGANSRRSRDAALTHAVLMFNMKLKPKNLGSKYCEHAGPALIPPWGPLRAQPRLCPACSAPTSAWDGSSIQSLHWTLRSRGRLFSRLSLSKRLWRSLHRACTQCWETGRVLPEEMQCEDYLFFERSAPGGRDWSVLFSAIYIRESLAHRKHSLEM